MTEIEIEYCHPCGFLNRAQDVQETVLETFGQQLDAVSLVVGDGGVFEVRVDEELVFDKSEDEYDVDAIVAAVRDELQAEA
jgi:selenoprotein W-related protein